MLPGPTNTLGPGGSRTNAPADGRGEKKAALAPWSFLLPGVAVDGGAPGRPGGDGAADYELCV